MINFIAWIVFSRLWLVVILIMLIMFYLVTFVWMLTTDNNNILSVWLISIIFRRMSVLMPIKVTLFSTTPSVLIIWILMLFCITIFMSFIMNLSTFPSLTILIITMIVILAYLLLLIMVSSVITAIFATFMIHFTIIIFWSAWFWCFIIVILWVLMFSVSLIIWDIFIWIILMPFITPTSGSVRSIVKLMVISAFLTSSLVSPTYYTSSIFFIWTFFRNHSLLIVLGFANFTWTSIIVLIVRSVVFTDELSTALKIILLIWYTIYLIISWGYLTKTCWECF
jgi:hypothetical protein